MDLLVGCRQTEAMVMMVEIALIESAAAAEAEAEAAIATAVEAAAALKIIKVGATGWYARVQVRYCV